MRKAIFLSIFLLCLIDLCFAQSNESMPLRTSIEQQGNMESSMGFVQIARSKYFNIYSQEEINLLKLIRRLDIRSEYLLMSGTTARQEQMQDMLGAIIDAIFLEASDVLRMYLYSFKGNIKICQNRQELNKAFRNFFNRDLKD